MLHRRLWTSERRARHGLQNSDVCALCDQAPETCRHLILGCVFSRAVWVILLHPIHLLVLAPDSEADIAEWWLHQRRRLDGASRTLFDSLLLLIAWSLWKERNNRTFGRPTSSVHSVVQAVIREGQDWVLGGFAPVGEIAQVWSQDSANM